MLTFPDGFLWGTATAAHQVEGANDNNDWWEWEQVAGHIKNGDRSTRACDWWQGERYREDFELARSLNQNALRLSVEWSRIEPSEGQWSGEALAYYRRVLTTLGQCGLEPLVTLFHFSLPRWLAHCGGWEAPETPRWFERFARKVVGEFDDLCTFWTTINEPVVYLYSGYVDGRWPPGKRDFGLAMRVGGNLLRAHSAAFAAIHEIQPHARVGIAHNLHTFRPAQPGSFVNRAVVRIQDYVYNWMILDALADGRLRLPMGTDRIPGLAGSQDYIGLNYYFATRVAVDWSKPGTLFGRQLPAEPWGVPYDDELLQWFGKGNLDPDGFADMCVALTKYDRPIYVLENGIPDRNDELRPRFLVQYLLALQRAIAAGAPVKGYMHWSLTDNFEWIEGYTLRFGLVHNDPATQKRALKPSAGLYARIARANGIADDLVDLPMRTIPERSADGT